jgi:23S rRNA pseudouridine955/2504/2580 synthase
MRDKVNTGALTGSSGVRQVEVAEADRGRRVDNLIGSLLKGIPKPLIYRWLRRGEVRINGGRVKPDHRVEAGDLLRLPPWREAADSADAPAPASLLQRLDGCVLLEADGLLIINKPSGMPVHGGTGMRFGVIELLRQLRADLPYLELVHRLDRATSGCLMLATDAARLRQLHRYIGGPEVGKRYLALLAGSPDFETQQVELALSRGLDEESQGHMQVDADGKPADTHFRVLERYACASLVEATLGTGRTHQIRVHAQHLGHPVCGDDRYGDPDANRLLLEAGLQRLFLHAAALRLALPGEALREVECPLPRDLEALLKRLQRMPGPASIQPRVR